MSIINVQVVQCRLIRIPTIRLINALINSVLAIKSSSGVLR